MVEEARTPRAVSSDELEFQIDELLQMAFETGRRISSKRISDSSHDLQADDIKPMLHESLRARLEDEIVPVHVMTNGGLDEAEVDREVVKKALVGLKLATLKKLAQEKGTRASGNAEELATRIAREYAWDKVDVARLILANEDEPSLERAHLSRIFPLEQGYEVTESRERLKRVAGRYIRIGIARWFLFEDIEEESDQTRVFGTFKTYQASVDGFEDVAALSAHPQDAAVQLELGNETMLQVIDAAVVPSRAAVTAFETICGVRALGYIPHAELAGQPSTESLHPVSLFLIDILHNRLADLDLVDLNLTVARFRVRDLDPAEEGDRSNLERRPELKAVRFEGEHLFDSAAACRLLTVERRALVDVAFRISIKSESDFTSRFPVRISVERDHLVVQTGLGAGQHELSLEAHRKVISAVSAAVREGVADEARILRLYRRMVVRADASVPSEVADILLDNDLG